MLFGMNCSGSTYSQFFEKYDLNFSSYDGVQIAGNPTYTPTGTYTGGTTGYIDITWSAPVYGDAAKTTGLDSAALTALFTQNSGNSTAIGIACITDTASVACPGIQPSVGATQMRVHFTHTGVTSGVETIQLKAALDTIYDEKGAALPTSAGSAVIPLPDRWAPTVVNVTASTPNGAYKAGDTISIQVVFSENVTVTGIPQLTLATGTPATTAVSYVSTSPANTLNFTYTIASGNNSADLDYATTAALTAGASIKDAAGNNATLTLATPGSAASLGANKAIVVDTTAPAAPAALALLAADDTGVSNSDGITNKTSGMTIEGAAEANSTVKVYSPNTGGTLLGTVTADGVGNWSLAGLSFTETTHTIVATATDGAGNVSVASSVLSVTVDTTADAAPTALDLINASDTGASNSDNITKTTAPSFTVSCVNGSSVQLFDGATVTGSAVTCVGGTASLTTAVLADGAHSITAKQTDTAGNVSAASAALSVTIDTTAPTGYSVAIDQSYINAGNETNVSFTVAGAELGISFNYSISSDGGGAPLTGSGIVGTASFQITALNVSTLGDGNLTVGLTLTDTAGNAGLLVTNTKIKDKVAPVISAVTPTTGLGVTSSAVGYTLSEDCSTASAVWTHTGGSADGTSPHTRTFTGAELNSGAHSNIAFGSNPLVDLAVYSITFSCTDVAGNAATAVTVTGVTYSDGPPTIQSALALDT
ncbi:MAG TPA: Ig-like domain-containing protein, partial [Turneriella sp.]|nr:Ig-like domain-containing protein [Turneriella sp.]